jgi:hypothetical protein
MKRTLGWALLIWVGSLGICTAEDSPEKPIYVFDAIDVQAKTKWGQAPIVSASRWGVKVDTAEGIKRFSYSGDFRLYPTTGSAREIVEVESFNTVLGDARRNEREARAMAEVQQYQIETDIAISDIARSGGNLSGAAQTRIAELRGEYDEFEENIRGSIESGNYESEELRDSIYLTLELRSPQEVRDAYCVVKIRYNVPNLDFPGGRQLLTIGQVRRVGHLEEGKSRKVKLNFRLRPGYLEEARPEFHLFSGDGEKLATTIAPGLRKLTREAFLKQQP